MTNHNSDEYDDGHTIDYGPLQSQPPKKKRRTLKIVGITFGAVVAIIIFGGVMAAGTGATVTKVPTQTAPTIAPTETATAPAPPAPTPAPVAPIAPAPTGPVTTFSDGTYQVGVDIAPGRYKTAGADPSLFANNCYTERESNDSGEFSAIIANNNTVGPYSVTVRKGEFFKADGCLPFTKVG